MVSLIAISKLWARTFVGWCFQISRWSALFALGLLASACANVGGYSAPKHAPATVENRSVNNSSAADNVVVDGQVLPLPDRSDIQVEELRSGAPVSAVVQRLLASADQQRGDREYSAAANSLERALRIEPRNAVLWNRLADIRFAQNNWQQAIQLAAKSNTLSADDHQLRRRNWYLMANSYAALENPVQAQKYRAKLSQ